MFYPTWIWDVLVFQLVELSANSMNVDLVHIEVVVESLTAHGSFSVRIPIGSLVDIQKVLIDAVALLHRHGRFTTLDSRHFKGTGTTTILY